MIQIAIYWNQKSGQVLVPTTAKTEAGYFLETEPVETATIQDRPSVLNAISAAAAKGNKIVPTPTRDNLSNWVILPYTKMRNRKAAEESYSVASISHSAAADSQLQIWKRPDKGRGYIPDPHQLTLFPKGTSLEDISRLLVEIMNSARTN